MRVPISDRGKRFRLVASQNVLTAFDKYAKTIKSLLAETLGLPDRPLGLR